MAPKRARKAKSTSTSYDESRFPNKGIYDRFIDSLANRKVVPEWAFEIFEDTFPNIDRIISRQNLLTFCMGDPGLAAITIVREFFAATELQQEGRVLVRAKEVIFDKDTINNYYEIPLVPVDEFNVYLSEPNLDEVIWYLCPFRTTWVARQRNAPAPHFPKGDMSTTAKTWFYFVCARLMPSLHHTKVTKDRAILIYCILTGKAIDVGSVIHSQIMYAVRTKGVSLLFPSLITDLCRKAGVQWDLREEILQSDNPLNTRMIMSLKDPIPRSASTSKAGVSETVPSTLGSSLTVDDRLDAIETGLREHKQEFQKF